MRAEELRKIGPPALLFRMGFTRLAEAEGAVVRLQWHIHHLIAHGKYSYIVFLVDGVLL